MKLNLLLCLLLVSGLAEAQDKPQYDFKPVDDRIRGWVEKAYYEGAAVRIVKNDSVLFEKYYGNYTPETEAYIASAGKWLAAATIAAVVDEGKISWDDKAKKWLPELKDQKGQATLAQLLSHTAGYPDYQPKGAHPDDYQTLAESVRHIVDLPAQHAPGAVFSYGGLAMQVAGRMTELAAGKNWESIFQEKIAGPLRMKNTHFTPVDTTPGHNPMLGGGARTTLPDYANFLSMIMNNGIFEGKRVLSEEAIRYMEADHVKDAAVKPGEFVEKARGRKGKDIYGLGHWREETDEAGNPTLLSSPGWAGAYPWVDRKNRIYGFILVRVNTANAGKDGFSSFYASPELPLMVRAIVAEKK